MGQYPNVLNTITVEVVQARHAIYSILELISVFRLGIIAPRSVPFDLSGGRTSIALHHTFAIDVSRESLSVVYLEGMGCRGSCSVRVGRLD